MDLEYARQALRSQPFSVLVGARLVEFGEGGATIEVDVRDDLRQQNGYLHGGVLAYAADNTLTFAAGSVLGPALLTAGFTIDYLRPVQGGVLRACGKVVHTSRRRAACRCDLYTVDESGPGLCAVAQGNIAKVA
jgi:uncharacterized protein (TIGR00369 family)